jgi:hypothetical protein
MSGGHNYLLIKKLDTLDDVLASIVSLSRSFMNGSVRDHFPFTNIHLCVIVPMSSDAFV